MTDLDLSNEEWRAFWEDCETVPFGSSDFQTINFVVNELSPARARRQALLELQQKIAALNEAKFRRRRFTIKLRILHKKLVAEVDPDERELIQVDIDEMEEKIVPEDKLIRDALRTVNVLREVLKKLPTVTREEFEKAEAEYWPRRLMVEAQRQYLATGRVTEGHLEALEKLGVEPTKVALQIEGAVAKRIAEVKALPPANPEV